MDTDAAIRLAQEWLGAHDSAPERGLELRSHLASELRASIPDGAVVGVAEIGSAPWVVALSEGLLSVVTIEAADEGAVLAHSRLLPLVPAPEVSVVSRFDPRSRSSIWTLHTAIGQPLALQTSEVSQAMFSAEIRPSSGELVMRELAVRLGWMDTREVG